MSDAPCPLGCGTPARTRYRLAKFDVVECEGCGILLRHPFPDAAELRALYEDEAYHASAYFAGQDDPATLDRRPEVRIYREALARLSTEHLHATGDATVSAPAVSAPAMSAPAMGTPADTHDPGRRVAGGDRPALLDIGCGTGLFLSLAQASGFEVEGVEISESMAASARARYGVRVACGEFGRVQLARNAYDVITMWDLLEHVVDPVAVLERCRALLAPGGSIVIFTIDSSSLFNQIGDLAYRITAHRLSRPLELLYDARHNCYFTPSTLDGLLRRAGLRVSGRSAYRAHLGRWLSEPAPAFIRIGGAVVDLLSVAVRRQYRQLVYCKGA
jgi:SAM-dependent methyltransferase